MSDCIFCKIINREVPADIIYENDLVLAFLDINPASLGHTLVISKKHFENIYDIPEDYLKEIVVVSKKIVLMYKEIFKIENVQLINNAGKYAQQEVMHFHLHIIPRAQGDGINLAHIQDEKLREQFSAFMNKFKNSGIV